jgi:hypothetical protein
MGLVQLASSGRSTEWTQCHPIKNTKKNTTTTTADELYYNTDATISSTHMNE